MQMESVNQATLTPLVCQALQDETAAVIDWSHQPLEGGFSGAGVHRFQGQAQTTDGNKPWSLILKVVSPDTGGPAPTDFDYWKREGLLYQSALLADLPRDLIVPRCFEVAAYPGEECWLWLEDMGAIDNEEWSLAQYGIAARHLGQFNGAYLVGRPQPPYQWLRGPDVHQRLALAEPGIAELPRLCHHPLFAELLNETQVARIINLWEKRAHLLAALDQLPQTFCHRDAFRRNLIMRRDADSREQTVAIDWGSAGLGMLGEELVPLFAATLNFVAIDIDRIAELAELIFAGYLAGLRDAGWAGDERLVRFGFTALVTLKTGVADPAIKLPNVARRVAALPPDVEPPRLLNPGGTVQAAAAAHHWLDMGDEALALSECLKPDVLSKDFQCG